MSGAFTNLAEYDPHPSITRGRDAWATIKASRSVERRSWHDVGTALRLGRRSCIGENEFGNWCDANGFSEIGATARDAAEQYARTKFSPGGYGRLPLGLREWYWNRDKKPTQRPRRAKQIIPSMVVVVPETPSAAVSTELSSRVVYGQLDSVRLQAASFC